MNLGYVYLVLTVAADSIGIGFLNKAEGFSNLKYLTLGLLTINAGLISFSLALKTIPMTIANAMFAGLATFSIALVGWLYFGEKYSALQYGCMGLILVGVVGLNLTGVGK